MNLGDEFKCIIGAYYGVKTMDEYDLKEYILKDIEDYVKNFIKTNPIKNFDYVNEARNINDNVSLKTKLQDSLLILTRINAPLELILLVRKKLKKINREENLYNY